LGNSKNTVLMDINKLWAFNKQHIDNIIPRYSCVKNDGLVQVTIEDLPDVYEEVDVLKCKTNPNLGTKKLLRYNKIFLDQSDVKSLADGEEFTIMDWGNMILQSRTQEGDLYKTMVVKSNIGGDFKKTKKITWVSQSPNLVKVKLLFFDSLINIPTIPKEPKIPDPKVPKIEFGTYVNLDSKHEVSGIAEPSIRELKIGEALQFTRRGYFMLDGIEDDTMIFVNTPDGHEKDVWK